MRNGRESRWLRGGLAATALGGAACLLIAGCRGGSAAPAASATGATASPSPAGMRLFITPASGTSRVNPAAGITVTAAGGKISGVTVQVADGQAAGTTTATGSNAVAAGAAPGHWPPRRATR